MTRPSPTESDASASLYYPAPAHERQRIGLPRLMEMRFRGLDLAPIGKNLIERIEREPTDANALLDLSCLMFLNGQTALGLRLQADALALTRDFELPAQGPERLRLLVLQRAGVLMDNMPVEFLLHGSDTTVITHYVDETEARRLGDVALPAHDVLCVGICEAPDAHGLLTALQRGLAHHSRPVLNGPERIARLSRGTLAQAVGDLPGAVVPMNLRVKRSTLEDVAAGRQPLEALLPDRAAPVIVRPLGSHAGHDLERLGNSTEVADYLAGYAEALADTASERHGGAPDD